MNIFQMLSFQENLTIFLHWIQNWNTTGNSKTYNDLRHYNDKHYYSYKEKIPWKQSGVQTMQKENSIYSASKENRWQSQYRDNRRFDSTSSYGGYSSNRYSRGARERRDIFDQLESFMSLLVIDIQIGFKFTKTQILCKCEFSFFFQQTIRYEILHSPNDMWSKALFITTGQVSFPRHFPYSIHVSSHSWAKWKCFVQFLWKLFSLPAENESDDDEYSRASLATEEECDSIYSENCRFSVLGLLLSKDKPMLWFSRIL